MNNLFEISKVEFKQLIYVSEINFEGDPNENIILLDLLRLIEQEERQILPHQEQFEIIKLGIKEGQKEIKIRTSINLSTHAKLIILLQEFWDVSASSY